MEQYIFSIIMFLLGLVVSVIGFFLKRTIGRVDKQDDDIANIKDGYVSKDGLDRFEANIKEDITSLRKEYEKRLDKLSCDIEGIKEDYITKEDFFREQAKTDRKLDQILDILLKGKVT